MTTPAEEMREAARLMRERAAPLTEGSWESLPWHTEECADNDSGLSCCCIVAQGEIKPFSEAQVPAIQYVADAESPEFAVHIASWHPGVALAVADLLDEVADDRHDTLDAWVENAALKIARAFLGIKEETRRVMGPFDTSRDACNAAMTATPLGDGTITAANLHLLLAAIEAAGVSLGSYDQTVVGWLSRNDRATCAVVAGLVERAYEAGLQCEGGSND